MQVPLKELLFAVSRALDFVEEELLGVTTNHGKRAAYISASICGALGMSREEVFDMGCCAILHDNALTEYMLKAGPGGLARLERFQEHCSRGEENAMAFPFAGNAAGIVLHHHENWDGSGFHGLKAEEIPPRAAVLRLADNLDLLLRLGQSRPGLAEEIRAHVARHSGKLYWPRAVEALLGLLETDFLEKLTDERINEALLREMPYLPVDLSTRQLLEICGLFAFIIDAKSPFTKNHSSGLAEIIGRLAPFYQIEGGRRDRLMIAAYLHDIGKLATPLPILEKPGPLNLEEMAVMREHVAISGQILGEVSGLEQIAHWCGKHHEKLNGQGYPVGCAAGELDFECRLLSCGDIYQALTEDRPYRAGMGHAEAVAIMKDMAAKGEIDGAIVGDMEASLA